jgi:hypothetical protein
VHIHGPSYRFPSAVVRTEAGKTRQVRTIDLEPVSATAPPPPAATASPEA